MTSLVLAPGSYLVSAKSPGGEELPIMVLRVHRREVGEDHSPGQWVAFPLPDGPDLASSSILLHLGARMGVLPVEFESEAFLDAIQQQRQLCLVADTNALYNGAFLQALRLRRDLATHAVVPDQVFMELQRQREVWPKGTRRGPWDFVSGKGKASSGARALKRVRHLPAIVHFVRPPDAMVRYFGRDVFTAEADGPGYHRDRLILEALRRQREAMSDMQVWLVTGDANLARQAAIEGFRVGLVRVRRPDGQLILTSPSIDPYSLRPVWCAVDDFLEELIWRFGRIVTQKYGSSTRSTYSLPQDDHELASMEIDQDESRVEISHGTKPIPEWPFSSFATSGDVTVEAPGKAPGAASLVKQLLDLAEAGSQERSRFYEPVYPYMYALGWAKKLDSGDLEITQRGREVAISWLELEDAPAERWCDWIRDTQADVRRLAPMAQLLASIPAGRSVNKNDLAGLMSVGSGIAESQARLANAFGLALRRDGLVWAVSDPTPDEAASAVLRAAAMLLRAETAQAESRAVRVDRLFWSFVTDGHALSLVTFRAGILRLVANGVVRLGGTAPDSAEMGQIRISVLVPGKKSKPESRKIALGAGDFLVPGESAQMLQLLEAK